MRPFFATKEPGRGTGLGPSIVYGFARQSGGAVRMRSEEGRGAVEMGFPAVEVEDRTAPPVETRSVDRPGDETIVVVEDRPDVAELARSILDDFGYTVLVAGDARRALDLLEGQAEVDMLFSDLIMPGGMDGVVLAREARRRQPRLKVLLTTGYAESSIERTDAGGTEFDIIEKPYRRTELARRVRTILDGPTGVG